VEDADGGDVCVIRQNPSIVVHSRQWGALLRSTSRGDWASWSNVTRARPVGEGLGLFYPPLESSATSGNTVALAMQALYVSRDTATTWTWRGYPAAGIGTALAIPDPDTVLVGLDNGSVLRSTFGSGAWSTLTALNAPRPGAPISDLVAEPGGTGRIWATSTFLGSGRVFRSDDGGMNWMDVERADAEHVTYWITVRNFTAGPVTFEGRFCVLSRY
jgi:hypothetical protein